MARIAIIRKIDDNKALVLAHRPDNGNSKSGEVIIDDLPNRPKEVGKSAVLYCNPETGETWFEQEDRPLTPEEMEVEEAKEMFRNEGREEVKAIVKEAAGMDELRGQARERLIEAGVLDE